MKQASVTIIILSLILFSSCGGEKAKTTKKDIPAKVKKEAVNIPAFNADSAYQFVADQVNFGPRVPGSKSQELCARYLTEKLTQFSATVQQQTFKMRAYNDEILDGINIIGSYNVDAKRRILLSSHWDSRPYADHDENEAFHRTPIDGANDGASGVGVLLEMARQFGMQNPTVGVDIVLFDLEDFGPPDDTQGEDGGEFWGLGSQYWAKNPHTFGYRAAYGILLDMVGAPNAVFPMEGFSVYYAPHIVRKVWNKAQSLGYESYFPQTQGTYVNDDHLYVNKYANIPMIDIIHLDQDSKNSTFFDHWHTHNDNMDAIDKTPLGVVGEVLLNLIYNE